MKRFLLTAGLDYYPNYGTRDWIGCFETRQEAEEAFQELQLNKYKKDWYEIIDLNDWTFETNTETSDEDE